MSQILPSPADCCRPCPSPLVQDIPGAQGPAGADGTNGANGANAWTTVTAIFAMPVEGGDVTVEVGNAVWTAIGENLFIGDPAAAARGTMQVVGKPDSTHLTLRNLANTAAGTYTNNSAPGTPFPVTTVVSPSGLQGPAGTNGSGGAIATGKYLVQQLVGGLPAAAQDLSILTTGLMKVTTATGAVTSVPIGITASAVAPVDAGGALTPGLVVSAVAGGLKTDTAANTRTALGLGTIAVQNFNNVGITGGSIAVTPISGSTGSFTTLAASGATTLNGTFALPSGSIQTIGAASTIHTTAGKAKVVGNAGPVTVGTTPTCDNGVSDGQICLIQGTNDTNTVTVQDDGTLPGSKLRLGATTRVLGKGDNLLLEWDATDATWYEVSFSALV